MPKIRDLGINVIPETARPPEIGGGGCGYTWGACTPTPQCTPSPFHFTYGCHGGAYTPPNCTPSPGTNPTDVCDYGYGRPPNCTPSPGTQPTEACYYRTPNCTPSPGTNPTWECHPGGLTLEACNQLKQQLQRQIEQLDELAKNLGPKTAEEIDAREAELKAELEELARRRSQLT